MSMPTGDTPEKADDFYLYLNAHQQTTHPVQTWHVDWMSLAWLWGFASILDRRSCSSGSSSTGRRGSARASIRWTASAAGRRKPPDRRRGSSSSSPRSWSGSRSRSSSGTSSGGRSSDGRRRASRSSRIPR